MRTPKSAALTMEEIREQEKQRDMDDAMRAVDAIRRILMSDGARKQFIDLMDCEHRTHQQAFGRLMVWWINHNAAKAVPGGEYDLRNKATVELCWQITHNIEPKYLSLPVI